MQVAGGREEMMNCLRCTVFHFCRMKRFMEMDGGDGCTTMNVLNDTSVHLKMVKMVNFMSSVFFKKIFIYFGCSGS